jgi:hypothetical protein
MEYSIGWGADFLSDEKASQPARPARPMANRTLIRAKYRTPFLRERW